MASWEGSWAQLERRPDEGRHAPGATPPPLYPSPLLRPDFAQSDPNSKKKTWSPLHGQTHGCILLHTAHYVVHTVIVGCLCLKRFQLTFGYLECLGQPSMATMILWPASADAWRVSMRIRGIRRSAGVKRCRVDWIEKENKAMTTVLNQAKLICVWHMMRASTPTSLIWETFSMPQNGLQFLLMIPTTFPVGLWAASAANIFNCSDTGTQNSIRYCSYKG